ncbi:unnamed protein product [Arctia plantaginis]|uniref:Uncharacterized protein n=1 Tax=Arctia plantaginis TaxID=874455 RepID=A0A8S1BP86_ARCPL|nr:unnamed protein product [Arctia plantaginis]
MVGNRVRIETCDGVGGSPPMTGSALCCRRERDCVYLSGSAFEERTRARPHHYAPQLFVSRHFYYAPENSAATFFPGVIVLYC